MTTSANQKDGELQADSVIKEDLITAAGGKRYRTKMYRLDMILAVGFATLSPKQLAKATPMSRSRTLA